MNYPDLYGKLTAHTYYNDFWWGFNYTLPQPLKYNIFNFDPCPSLICGRGELCFVSATSRISYILSTKELLLRRQ